ncbi:MAG: hypothetical protein RIR54_601, partial [Actinomycetota bacterium]
SPAYCASSSTKVVIAKCGGCAMPSDTKSIVWCARASAQSRTRLSGQVNGGISLPKRYGPSPYAEMP